MTTIRIQAEVLDTLKQHLDRAYPEETGAFALIGMVRHGDPAADLVVRELVLPELNDWVRKGEDMLTPTSDFINRATVKADRLGLGIAFIHSHPGSGHPAALSWIDERSTLLLFRNLSSILPGAPLASIVFTRDSVAGVVSDGLTGAETRKLTRLRVIGNSVKFIWAFGEEPPPQEGHADTEFARQVLALGELGQQVISQLEVAIVGAGGTGSAVGEQLARLGVRRFVLIDDDRIVRSNVTRIYGSTPYDAKRKRLKVDVLARLIKKISPKSSVEKFSSSVTEQGFTERLVDVDVVFCCTDTDGSRAVLNELAYRHLVPVLDLGCKIDVEGHRVRGIFGRVRYLRPGLPCLWCTGTIDGNRILQESLSESERERLRASGYGSGMGPQPSVVYLTSLVASLAVSEFLSIFLDSTAEVSGSWLLVDLAQPQLTRVHSLKDPSCRCVSLTGLGSDGRILRSLPKAHPLR